MSQMLTNALRQFYQKASRDGCVQVAEIQQCCSLFNVNIDQGSAMQLLLKLAGRDQRLTETEFANGMSNFLMQNLGQQLRNFYQRACGDGMLQIAEIQQVMGMFGCQIDPQTAQQLLFRIAGRDQRVTENEFAQGILAAVGERKLAQQQGSGVQLTINLGGGQPQMMQQPMGMQQQPQMMQQQPQMMQQQPQMNQMGMQQPMGMQQQHQPQMNMGMQMPMGMMQPGCMQLPFMAGQGMMGGLTPEQMQLKQFFSQACADGMIQVQEVQQSCAICGVQVDQQTAQQLIQQIAGTDRRITETEFVTGISTFCQQRKMMMMQQQQMMMGGGMGGMMPMMPM